HGGAHLHAEAFFHGSGHLVAHALELDVSKLIEFLLPVPLSVQAAALRFCALCHTNDPVALALLEALLHAGADLVDIEGELRQQDVVSATGHARMQRNPAGVTAHNLNDHDALVGFRSGVQTVDGLGGHGDGGVEAEGVIHAIDVVVDGLRDPDDRDAVIMQELRAPQGTITTDRDQRVDLMLREVGLDRVDLGLELIGVEPAGTENRAAVTNDAVDVSVVIKRDHAVFHQPLVAILEADDLDPRRPRGAHDTTDHCVQAGAIPTTGQNRDTHIFEFSSRAVPPARVVPLRPYASNTSCAGPVLAWRFPKEP